VIASGHDNRFGHPRAEVLARYDAIGSEIEGTAASGAITVRLREHAPIEVIRRRQQARRFWHEPTTPAPR
jgi:competence protein ComEC